VCLSKLRRSGAVDVPGARFAAPALGPRRLDGSQGKELNSPWTLLTYGGYAASDDGSEAEKNPQSFAQTGALESGPGIGGRRCLVELISLSWLAGRAPATLSGTG